MIAYEFDGQGGSGDDVSRFYWLSQPATANVITCLNADGSCERGDEVQYQAVRIDCWPQASDIVAVPAATVTPVDAAGISVGGGYAVAQFAAPMNWTQVLTALGYESSTDPAPIPQPGGPTLAGAVATAADLPGTADPQAVYLTRDTQMAHCRPDGEWQTTPWSPGCEEFFGCPADEVPDLQ